MILCKSISQLPSCKQFPAIFQVWLYWYWARRTVKVCNSIQHETSKTALKLVDQMMQIRPSGIMYMYFSYKDQQTISMKEWKNVNKTFNNWSPCYHKQHRKRCTLQTIWTSGIHTTHNTQLPLIYSIPCNLHLTRPDMLRETTLHTIHTAIHYLYPLQPRYNAHISQAPLIP